MRLTFEELKIITVGAHAVEQNDDGTVSFYKCTKKQIKAWYECGGDTLGTRSETTTGIRLDFHTNSKNLSFKTKRGGKFELLIDGMIRERYTPEQGSSVIERTVHLTDMRGEDKDEFRVTLVFPSHSIGVLEYIEIDDGAYFLRHDYSTGILFIGDSITQGHNSYYDSLSFAWRVALYYNAECMINGIGGAFYEPKTFDVPDFDPDTVIIAYGTNDATRFKVFEDMETRVKNYLDLVKEAYGDKRVVIISPIWRGNAEMKPMGDDFKKKRLMVEWEAKARGFEVISGLDLVPPRAEFFADTYLHPNDLGFGVYAENLIQALNKNN